ncbi:MAG: NADPH:quinone oxidoreductase family protein [Frankiales bacterium]|nr:NADPH:quinone oxidoreductase family protein [Frankiales bacterium]
MRAVLVPDLSGPSGVRIADVPEPVGAHPRSGGRRVLVEVHAVGLSFIDPLQTHGSYQAGVSPPYVCGSELAGVVLEAPPGALVAPGDRVAGIVWQGAMAERALAIDDLLVKLPDSTSFVEGAGVYMNYATGWYALDTSRVRPGGTVLVTGAAGGVGTAVLDLAAAFDVKTIALVSSDEKAQVALDCGAGHVVRTDSPWLEEIRALTGGRGVEAFVDMVGGDQFLDTVRALAIGGHGIIVGFAGGSIPELKMNRLLLRNLSLTGIEMTVMEREHPGTLKRVRDGVQALLDAGRIRPAVVSVFPMEEAAAALSSLEQRTAMGKVVVEVARS